MISQEPSNGTAGDDVYLAPLDGYSRCGLLKAIYPDDTITYRVYHDGDLIAEYDDFNGGYRKYLEYVEYERTKRHKRTIVTDSRGRMHRWRERV